MLNHYERPQAEMRILLNTILVLPSVQWLWNLRIRMTDQSTE